MARENVDARGLDPEAEGYEEACAAAYAEELARAKEVCAREHEQVKAVGGLCVIGTERHESRRIDNQLRGRAGRQGDPGETQFYLSLEDDLMRLFGGERVEKLSGLMSAADMDNMPIQNKWVSKAVESAQRKVENINFSMRKNVLEYDDVMNKQRMEIYEERNRILDGKDLAAHTNDVMEDIVSRGVAEFASGGHGEGTDFDGLHNWLVDLTGHGDAPRFDDVDAKDLEAEVLGFVRSCYEEKAERLGEDLIRQLDSQIMLRVIDTRWMSYLQEMDYLKQGIGLRGFGQRDPLTEYRSEAHAAFGALVSTMYEDYLRTVLRTEVRQEPAAFANDPSAGALRSATYSGPGEVDGDTGSSTLRRQAAARVANAAGKAPAPAQGKVKTYVKAESGDPYANVGRNDPCPCGSGKKFKNCHGRNR